MSVPKNNAEIRRPMFRMQTMPPNTTPGPFAPANSVPAKPLMDLLPPTEKKPPIPQFPTIIRSNTKYVELRQCDLKKKFSSVAISSNPPMRYSQQNILGFFSTVQSMSPFNQGEHSMPKTRSVSPSKVSCEDVHQRYTPQLHKNSCGPDGGLPRVVSLTPMHTASITNQTGLGHFRSSGHGSILVHDNLKQHGTIGHKSPRKQQNRDKPKRNKKRKGKKIRLGDIQLADFSSTIDYNRRNGTFSEINLFSH